jgi:hypothetical protein
MYRLSFSTIPSAAHKRGSARVTVDRLGDKRLEQRHARCSTVG